MRESFRKPAVVAALLLAAALGAACGPKTLKARLINSERKATQAERQLDEAERAMAQLEPDQAARHLEDARESMADPDIGYYPERTLIAERLERASARLPAVRKEREKRDLELAVNDRQAKVSKALTELQHAVEAIRASLERSTVSGGRDAVEELNDELDDGRELEPKSAEFARWTKGVRGKLEALNAEVVLAAKRLAVTEGPGEKYREGRALRAEARASKDKEKKRALNTDARDKFLACHKEVKELLEEARAVASAIVVIEGQRLSTSSLSSRCVHEAEAAAKAAAPPKKGPAGKGKVSSR